MPDRGCLSGPTQRPYTSHPRGALGRASRTASRLSLSSSRTAPIIAARGSGWSERQAPLPLRACRNETNPRHQRPSSGRTIVDNTVSGPLPPGISVPPMPPSPSMHIKRPKADLLSLSGARFGENTNQTLYLILSPNPDLNPLGSIYPDIGQEFGACIPPSGAVTRPGFDRRCT